MMSPPSIEAVPQLWSKPPYQIGKPASRKRGWNRLNRKMNDLSAQGIPRSEIVAPGAAVASAGAWPLSVADSTSSCGALAAGAALSGSFAYVPGLGEPAASFL